jgi:hypothetical protein
VETLDQTGNQVCDLQFVIAFVCSFQVILLHGFDNFPAMDDLRQILLDQYKRISFEPGYQPTLRPDHQYRTVKEGSSWEGSGPIQLLTYLRILLSPITTRDTEIQQG